METRKLMRLGRSSIVISLPRSWINMNKLKKGDIVSMAVQRDGSLLILPGIRKEIPVKKISLVIKQDDDERFIARKIIACYLNGYSAIELISPKFFLAKQQRVIKKVISSLKMSIMETSPRRIYLESLLDESKVSVSRTLRRIHMIIISMCQGITDVLRDWNIELAKSFYSLYDEVDQFTLLLLRLSKKGIEDPMLTIEVGLEPKDCLDLTMLAYKLERIAHCLADIAQRVLLLNKLGQKLPPYLLEPLLEMHELACKLYDETMKAYFSLDIELANKAIDSIAEVEKLSQKASEALVKETNSAVVCAFCYMREKIESMARYSVDIAKLVINRSCLAMEKEFEK